MSVLNEQFQERLAEVNTYFAFLVMIEAQAQSGPPKLHGSDTPISTEQQRILYSGVYLQLYNLVEATMDKCIKAIVAAACLKGVWKPGDLSDALQREWVRAKAHTHVDLNFENRLEKTLDLYKHLINALPIEIFDIKKGGGNWDDLEIEAIFKRLGCEIVLSAPVKSAIKRKFRDDLGALRLLKRLRNDLAHGSISFAQCAENETVTQLKLLRDVTVEYLIEVISCITKYLDDFGYIQPNRRPL